MTDFYYILKDKEERRGRSIRLVFLYSKGKKKTPRQRRRISREIQEIKDAINATSVNKIKREQEEREAVG